MDPPPPPEPEPEADPDPATTTEVVHRRKPHHPKTWRSHLRKEREQKKRAYLRRRRVLLSRRLARLKREREEEWWRTIRISCCCFLLCCCLGLELIVIAMTALFQSTGFIFGNALFGDLYQGESVARRGTEGMVSAVDGLFPCPPRVVHEMSRLNSADTTWDDYLAARSMDENSDCEELLERYLDSFPMTRSCASMGHGGRYWGMPDSVWNLIRFRSRIWSEIGDGLLSMCEHRKKRLVRLEEIRQQRRQKQQLQSQPPPPPLKIWFSNWYVSASFLRPNVFEGCNAQCELINGSTITVAKSEPDVVLIFDYCDYRTSYLSHIIPGYRSSPEKPSLWDSNNTEQQQQTKKPLLAFVGFETIFPSPSLDPKTERLAQTCRARLDVYAEGNRFAELPVYFADLETLLKIRNPETGKLLYPAADTLPSGPSYELELKELISSSIDQQKRRNAAMTILSHCKGNMWTKRAQYRYEYIVVLRKYFSVDIFGACTMKWIPGEELAHTFFDWTQQTFTSAKVQLTNPERRRNPCATMKKFPFYLAFENGLRDGYVTEKLWNALMCPYSIPVYLGAPDIRRFFHPDDWAKYKFFVNANEFPDPRDLAAYLDYLYNNHTAYLEYFQWRIDGVYPRTSSSAKPIHRVFRNAKGQNIAFPCRLCELVSGVESPEDMEYGEFLWLGPSLDVDQQNYLTKLE